MTREPHSVARSAWIARAVLGWLLHAVAVSCVYLFFAPMFGAMVAWKVAWGAAILIASGIAFRAHTWFQKRERERRGGRRIRRERLPWPLPRCVALLFTGLSLFTIGWAEALVGYNPDFPLGAMMGWTIFVGGGGGMSLVSAWELHRAIHPRNLEAATERQRLSAGSGVVAWSAAAVAALGLALLVIVGIDSLKGWRLPGFGRLIMAVVGVGIVLAAAVAYARSAQRENSRMHAAGRRLGFRRRRRSPERPSPPDPHGSQ